MERESLTNLRFRLIKLQEEVDRSRTNIKLAIFSGDKLPNDGAGAREELEALDNLWEAAEEVDMWIKHYIDNLPEPEDCEVCGWLF